MYIEVRPDQEIAHAVKMPPDYGIVHAIKVIDTSMTVGLPPLVIFPANESNPFLRICSCNTNTPSPSREIRKLDCRVA